MVLYVTYREMITKTVIDKIYINKYPTEEYEHMKRFCLDDDYITTDSGLFIKNIDIICDNGTVSVRECDDWGKDAHWFMPLYFDRPYKKGDRYVYDID